MRREFIKQFVSLNITLILVILSQEIQHLPFLQKPHELYPLGIQEGETGLKV